MNVTVSEVFGPTIQGEGPSAGRRAVFVRLGRCNLNCVWCDTPYTWDWHGQNGLVYDPVDELEVQTTDDVLTDCRELANGAPAILVITGGEPLLQVEACEALAGGWMRTPGQPRHIEIETNGTRMPSDLLRSAAAFNVSPKLSGSGCSERARYRPDVLEAFARTVRADFKFVVACPADLDEIDALVIEHQVPPHRVWLMPEGRHPDDVAAGYAELAPHAIQRGYNLSNRLHVLLWGDTRGH